MKTPLSVVITTYNNADTLDQCLQSVSWADERLVLDSFSRDNTAAIAESHGARWEQHEFEGYGRQKQRAVNAASHDWVLLLDADEALSEAAAGEVLDLLGTGDPACAGYRLPRREQLFWRFQRNTTRFTEHLRLFDRRRAQFDDNPVHAAPKVSGPVGRLRQPIIHYGEVDIHTKVAKINHYSTGLRDHKLAGKPRFIRLRMVFYPWFAFLREYLLHRQIVNGWAGYVAARTAAYYAFLKYAKLYEALQRRQPGTRPPRY